MRILLTVLFLLTACTSDPHPNAAVDKAVNAQIGTAAAAANAYVEISKLNPDKNKHTEVMDREVGVVADNLPHPTEAQSLEALKRAYAALKADHEEVARLYAEARAEAKLMADAVLEARLKAAADAKDKARRAKLMGYQSNIMLFASLCFTVAGAGALYKANTRLSLLCAGLAALCLMVSQFISRVPDSHFHVVFWLCIAGLITLPPALFYGYKVGLWQKPTTTKITKGDYVAELT